MPARGIIIVGGGQGGFQVAASLRELGYAKPITLVCDEPIAPYQRPPLSKAFLLGETNRERLLLRPLAFYERQSIRLILGERVIGIERAPRRVLLSSGSRLEYEHLVLATGARNRILAVPGADLDGVLYLRTLAESELIRERLAAAKNVVIIGAGFIGLELAAVASKLGKSVHVIDQMPRVMSRAVSKEMSEFFARAHRAWGVNLVLGAAILDIRAAEGGAKEVRTKDGRSLPADLVLVGIGIVPNAELAVEAGLRVDNGIVVDARLQTADPALSAIGDCANYPSRFYGSPVRLESVQNAVDHARCVAARLTGNAADYSSVPWFWSDQRDLKLQMVGPSANCDCTIVRGDIKTQKFSVYCFRNDQLCGIESVNRPADHMFGRRLLAAGAGVTPGQVADPAFDPKAFLANIGAGRV